MGLEVGNENVNGLMELGRCNELMFEVLKNSEYWKTTFCGHGGVKKWWRWLTIMRSFSWKLVGCLVEKPRELSILIIIPKALKPVRIVLEAPQTAK